jgi:hypothetical protein
VWDSNLWGRVPALEFTVSTTPVDCRTATEAVMTMFANENVELTDAVRSVRADVVVYRELLSDALATVARLQRELHEAREQLWVWRRDRANELRTR